MVEEETKEWLEENSVPFDDLIMLPEGRWEIEDHSFKKEKLSTMKTPVSLSMTNKRTVVCSKKKGWTF